jgi:DNA helicase HerA-like ATPase
MGRLLNRDAPTKLSDLLDKPVVLDLSGLGSETDRAFFAKAFLIWLYYHRLSQPRPRRSNHVIVLEEAHHMFLRKQGGGQSVLDGLLRQMRDLGESLVLLDQNPSESQAR